MRGGTSAHTQFFFERKLERPLSALALKLLCHLFLVRLFLATNVHYVEDIVFRLIDRCL